MWVIGSRDAFLQAVWHGTLVLSALSVLVLVILILRRWAMEKTAARQMVRRQEITRCLYAAIQSPVALNAASLIVVTPKDHQAVMQAALEMLRFLRGDDVQRIVTALRLWDMQHYLELTARDGSKGRRIQALTLLGYFEDPSSIGVLLQQANHADMYIQLAALRALALRGGTAHIHTVIELLSHSQQTNTLMLADILRRFGEAVVPSLLGLVRIGSNTEVRVAGLMALGFLGSLQAVDTLIDMTEDASAEIRAQAIAALGRIGDARAAATVMKHLEDTNQAVRVQAAQTLGQLRALQSMPALAARLDDEDWWVRLRAAEALHQFGVQGVAALQAYGTRDDRAGLIARQVLAERAEMA